MKIEEAVDRCKELTKDEHKEWVGISNQVAIKAVLKDYDTTKADLYSANCIINEKIDLLRDSINKDKIKEKLEKLNKQEKELENNIEDEEREQHSDASISYLLMDIYTKKEILKELLEEQNGKTSTKKQIQK